MADDIAERLRETIVAYDEWYQGRLKTSDTLLERFSCERKEAADEITRLRAENEKLREALKAERERCAKIAEQARDDTCDGPVAWSMADSIAAAIRESGNE